MFPCFFRIDNRYKILLNIIRYRTFIYLANITCHKNIASINTPLRHEITLPKPQ